MISANGGNVAIADAHRRADGIFGDCIRNPIDVAHFAGGAAKFAIFADDEAIILAVERDHVDWMSRGEAEAAALADGVVMQTVVAADHFAGSGDDFARLA